MAQFLSLFLELLDGVEGAVAVEVDAGREVHHEVGQHGDLLQDELVVLQHLSHVRCRGQDRFFNMWKSTIISYFRFSATLLKGHVIRASLNLHTPFITTEMNIHFS